MFNNNYTFHHGIIDSAFEHLHIFTHYLYSQGLFYSLGEPEIHRDLPTSSSQILGVEEYDTMPGLHKLNLPLFT